ncbi:hypothetical protein [Roseovarius litorisediminis]|nr:hypothetical protein [Roseovarius litorisediminis]
MEMAEAVRCIAAQVTGAVVAVLVLMIIASGKADY